MSRYLTAQPARTAVGEDFGKAPHWPTECGVADCEDAKEKEETGKSVARKTDVAIAVVTDPSGKTRRGFFSNFGDRDKPYTLLPGFTFQHWITRCHECYMRELDRTGKAA